MSTETTIPDSKTQYDTAKRELIQALTRKRAIDKTIATLEVQIYHFEGSYLTETTASGGNIIQGFDGYLKNQHSGRRRYEVSDNDRLFSNSSATYIKSLELQGDESVDDTATVAAAVTAVSLPPLPSRTQEQSAAAQKRERDKQYQRRKRASFKAASTASGDEYDVTTKSNKRRRLADDE